jgi:pimeloyl-ACP methyl ester carboxylesterase
MIKKPERHRSFMQEPCSPLRPGQKHNRRVFVAQAAQIQEQFVTLNGKKLHYAVAGQQDRPAVLLVHGASPSLTWKVWDLTIGPLAADLQVFALDLPGYGQSARHEGITLDPYPFDYFADTVIDFVAELRIGPATLIGSSAGGGVCLMAAANHPTLVRRLVLVDSSGAQDDHLRKCAADVRSPTLLIWQQEDAVIPVERGRQLEALIPGSHLEVLMGFDRPAPEHHNYNGHWPHRLNPERFNRLVLEFIKTLPGAK